MANGDLPPWMWATVTQVGTAGSCGHGAPPGWLCWYCQHPALGPAAPQAFQFGGWQCPGCSRCFSPAMTICPYCPVQTPVDVKDSADDDGGFAPLAPESGEVTGVCRIGRCGC